MLIVFLWCPTLLLFVALIMTILRIHTAETKTQLAFIECKNVASVLDFIIVQKLTFYPGFCQIHGHYIQV